jgi:HTH-type transcriptional regulator/antitoxin HigA
MTQITPQSGHPMRGGARWAAQTPPRPIRSQREHRAAMDESMRLARLIDARKATRAQTDAADVLRLLVTDYENRRFGEILERNAGGTPIDRLRYLMEEHKMGVVELGRLLGDRGLGTRVLSGERALSKAHIRKLAAHFHVNPGYFL